MPGGRPTKFSPELVTIICDAIERGHYLEHAAALANVNKTTVYDWLRRGEEGEEPYAEFPHFLKVAEAKAVERALVDIEAAEGGKDAKPWTNRAWWLERRHTSLFGRQIQQVEHSGVVATVKVELPQLPDDASPEERRRLLREMVGR